MRTLFHRIDHWLLLRQPRVWSTRVHVALLVALPLYALLAIGGLSARLIFSPTPTQIASGEAPNADYVNVSAISAASDQFQDSLLLSIAYSTLTSTIATTISLLFVAATLTGLLASVLWLRQVNQHNIDAILGVHKHGHGWLECGCYIVGIGVFAACGLWMYVWMSPGPGQMAAWREIDSATRREIRALSVAEGIPSATEFFAADGTIDYARVADRLVGISEPYQFHQLQLVRPAELDFNSTYGVMTGGGLKYQNAPLGEPAARYLNALAASAYTDTFVAKDGGARRVAIDSFAGGFLPWIVGLTAYALFAGKKTKMRYALSVITVTVFLAPIIVLIVTQIGIQIYASTRGYVYSNTQTYGMVIVSTIYVALFAPVLALSLIGRFARSSSRRHALATIAVPIGIGFGLLLVLSTVDIMIGSNWPIPPPISEEDYQQWRDTWYAAVRILPFVWLPLLPLLDAAFRRCRATPIA
jgi:hypothetical protein